jgi:hypothetical protein
MYSFLHKKEEKEASAPTPGDRERHLCVERGLFTCELFPDGPLGIEHLGLVLAEVGVGRGFHH